MLGNRFEWATIVIRASAGCALVLAVSCSPEREAPKGSNPREETAEMTAFGAPRLSKKDFDRFLAQAQEGDVAAMHTLSVHHLAGSERTEAYEWLRRAARLEDCEAIVLLVEDEFGGVLPREKRHWRSEQERLRCDPRRNYGLGPALNPSPDGMAEPPPPEN